MAVEVEYRSSQATWMRIWQFVKRYTLTESISAARVLLYLVNVQKPLLYGRVAVHFGDRYPRWASHFGKVNAYAMVVSQRAHPTHWNYHQTHRFPDLIPPEQELALTLE